MAVYNRSQSDENEPLLSNSEPEQRPDAGKYKWWKWGPHPYWLLPIIVVSSLARGSTMSPRVSVFTDVACRALSSATDCSNAPEVQARAARIQATVTTVTSVLSTVLTGPLSRWGDIHGRKPLLLFTLFGGLAMEFIFILVTREGSVFYNYAELFVVLGSVFDGVVGGLSTFNGVIHAYTSDCTQHGSRAKIFSTLSGMMFVGLACGSWLGGMVLKLRPDLSPYALFFGSVALLALIEVYILIMVPESNPKVISKSAEEPSVETSPRSIRNVATFFKSGLKHLIVGLVTPISMFIPRRVGNSMRRDWNLTFVGGALFLYLVSIGVYQIKYLYGKHVYAWKAEQLGFYMSLLWFSRAVNLLLLLPLIVSYFKPKPQNGEQPSIQSELRFDKILASTSLAIDALSDALIAIAPSSSQFAFVALSCLSSFTSGGNPTLHSLGAVCLHASGYSSEVGSLFGALAVLSAVAHVISPTIYAVTYGSTVASFPKAIFVLATVLLGLAVLLLSFVRSRHIPERLP